MNSFGVLEGKKVNITPLFQHCGIQTDSLYIIETPGMYPYKEKIEDNWAYFTAQGLKRLKEILDSEHRNVATIGIVGICSGVEGIAVEHIFHQSLKDLYVTDIDQEILTGTVMNIKNAAPHEHIQLIPLMGSFCEPLKEAGTRVDLVHANIPNLPARGGEDLTKGAEKGTFLPQQLYDKYQPPEEFVGWALAAQYAYLLSAKEVLAKGGSVVTELGGRIPMELAQKLFIACGLKLQEIVVGFKEQTEALIDFQGYHALEEQYGSSFEFYKYREGKEELEKHGLSNPTHAVSGSKIKQLLSPHKLSAGDALDLYHEQVPVGHTVHIFRGTIE